MTALNLLTLHPLLVTEPWFLCAQIPADQQGMVRSAYWAFLGFVIAITFNLIGSLVALCAMNGNDGRLTGFFLSAVYWFAGVPGAWILWYAR